MTAPLHGLLLAGGASRRMGRDKAALHYGGEPQLARAWRLLCEVTGRAFVSVQAGQRDDPLRGALPQITDTMPGVGPAAGILAAQEAFPDTAWLVLACDLPRLDLDTLRCLVAARDPSCDATAFRSAHDDLPEPLCAIWEPASHALLRARVGQGKPCPRKTLILARTHLLAPAGVALDNVNTPEEDARVREAETWPA